MKWTKIFGALGLLVGFCCLAAFASPVGASQPSSHSAAAISLVIAGPSAPVPLNWPLNVEVSVMNITNHAIGWSVPVSTSEDMGYWGFRYLLEKDGHEVATTVFDRNVTNRQRPDDPVELPPWISLVRVLRQPGKVFGMRINVKRLYKITEPGTYTFHVSRYDEVSKTVVKSNTITIAVTKPSQAPPPQVKAALPTTAGTSFTLGISMPQNGMAYYPAVAPHAYTVKSGSEIRLDFYVTNTSDHQIEYDPAISWYVFDVRDAQGGPAPLTPDGQYLRKQYGMGHMRALPVPPGQTLAAGGAWLSVIYNLSKPGKYTVQVSRFDDATKTWVKSNKLTLTVTP